MDKSKIIFGNKIKDSDYKKAVKSKEKYIKKFGDDTKNQYHLSVQHNSTLGDIMGVQNLVMSEEQLKTLPNNPLIIANIRMGFGHYRMSMAIASAANSMGYTPLWMDLASFKETTGSKVISAQNDLYSMGSRLSQKYKLFNQLIWERINYLTFKKLSYNSVDQKNSELMTPIFNDIDRNIPVVATHAWPAQASIHAGMKHVVNAIPDNWAMALHFSEGAIHAVQTPNVYLGYRTLAGMDKNADLNVMPEESIKYTGHYIDHELVSNIEIDCDRRIKRANEGKAQRLLLTIGGAGAQKEIFAEILELLIPKVRKEKACVYVNIGDYKDVYGWLCENVEGLKEMSTTHFDDFAEVLKFSENALENDVSGIHFFCHSNIFEAVYSTNLLMRSTDLLVTKPSELAFYPVPKLFIKRVGKHEMWGAIHSAEIGDGTPECDTIESTKQMLKLMLNDKTIIANMCENIKRNKKLGIYDGAYNCVKLATGK